MPVQGGGGVRGGQDKPRWQGSKLQGRQPPRPVRDPTLGVSLGVRWRGWLWDVGFTPSGRDVAAGGLLPR